MPVKLPVSPSLGGREDVQNFPRPDRLPPIKHHLPHKYGEEMQQYREDEDITMSFLTSLPSSILVTSRSAPFFSSRPIAAEAQGAVLQRQHRRQEAAGEAGRHQGPAQRIAEGADVQEGKGGQEHEHRKGLGSISTQTLRAQPFPGPEPNHRDWFGSRPLQRIRVRPLQRIRVQGLVWAVGFLQVSWVGGWGVLCLEQTPRQTSW